jgi:hypothetical protein
MVLWCFPQWNRFWTMYMTLMFLWRLFFVNSEATLLEIRTQYQTHDDPNTASHLLELWRIPDFIRNSKCVRIVGFQNIIRFFFITLWVWLLLLLWGKRIWLLLLLLCDKCAWLLLWGKWVWLLLLLLPLSKRVWLLCPIYPNSVSRIPTSETTSWVILVVYAIGPMCGLQT